MKFDKDIFLPVILCMALMLAWPSLSEYFGCAPAEQAGEESIELMPETPAAGTVPAVVPDNAVPAENINSATTVRKDAPKPLELKNQDITLFISPLNGDIIKTVFSKYENSARNGQLTISSPAGQYGALRLIGKNWHAAGVVESSVSDGKCRIVRQLVNGAEQLVVTQEFTIDPAGYVVNCNYSICNPGKTFVALNDAAISGGELSPWNQISGDKVRTASHRLDFVTQDGKHEDITADEDDEDFYLNPPPLVNWAATGNKYFCSILDADHAFTLWQNRYYMPSANGKNDYPVISAGAQLPGISIAPGSSAHFKFRLYNGPKMIDTLQTFAPDATDVMHLAWGPINYLARFLLWVLTFFQSICHSYGWSIVFLTLLVRAVFYPLTARGNESMKKMQKVQPMFKELREKYKDNPQLLNQKMAELYRKEGVNPFAGCLPILLQIPIFFALYAMLDNAVALRHVSFLWCNNLAAADTVFSIPLFYKDWALPINPLALAMTALLVVQQRMTPMAMDPAQKKMMALMPIVMLIFLYDLPSGLTLYWTVSNLFSIIQLWLQKRSSRTPGTPVPGK